MGCQKRLDGSFSKLCGESMKEIRNLSESVDIKAKKDLLGIVLHITDVAYKIPTAYGEAAAYTATLPSGEVVTFFGSSVMDTQEVAAGDVVKIDQKASKEGNKYYIFVPA